MIPVVLDTNILVSALLSPLGSPAKILALVYDRQITACYDDRILMEYEAVLLRPKFPFDPAEVSIVLDSIIKKGVRTIAPPLDTLFIDESDRKFYEVAKFCGAKLITGNQKHFPQEPDVVTAADFLATL